MIKNVNKFLFTLCDIIFTNHLLIYFIAKIYIYICLFANIEQHINSMEDRKCFAITILAHFHFICYSQILTTKNHLNPSKN